jgi:hypothetical protein
MRQVNRGDARKTLKELHKDPGLDSRAKGPSYQMGGLTPFSLPSSTPDFSM